MLITKELEALISKAAPAVKDLPVGSFKARAAARGAISALQDKVLTSLAGAKLMGQPNLGRSKDRFNGINVRADTPGSKLREGKPTLAIDRDGSLVMVCYGREEIVVEPFDVSRAETEDLPHITRGYTIALLCHLAAAEKAGERYESIGRLASIIVAAIRELGDAETMTQGSR